MSERYKQKTAGDYLVETVPLISAKATVREVLELLSTQAKNYSTITYIYLVNGKRVLTGVVSIKEVFIHSSQTLVATFASRELITTTADTKAEAVALLSIKNDLKAIPVINQQTGELLGIVPSDAIRNILHYGRIYDALNQAGANTFTEPETSLLAGTPLLHIEKRLPWLLFGLVGGLVAALIVRGFEQALAAHVLIVAFIPLVVYMADALGSQTEIIFVRALALEPRLQRFSAFKAYFTRELIVTVTLSLILGLLVGAITTWWFKAPELALLLFVALLSTLVLAMFTALIIPYYAVRRGYDPALTSGPVATVIRDVMTLVVYFLVVMLFI